MPGTVTLNPSGKRFTVFGNESILEAALRAGLALNYGCSNGRCGLCRARVVSGDTQRIKAHDYVIGEADKHQGLVLMCSYTATGEITLEAMEARGADDIPQQEIVAKVRKAALLTPEVQLLHLQTPRTQRLRFIAGQSATLTVGDLSTTLPIASCPCDDRNIQFHIRLCDEDQLSMRLAQARPGDPVTLRGPSGAFRLDEDSGRDRIFIAWETGFAPIKSVIEHAMQLEQPQALALYWIARDDSERYLDNLLQAWQDAFDNFHYTPLDWAAQDDAALDARLEDIARRHDPLREQDLYLAGPAAMLARFDTLFAHTLERRRVHSLTMP